MYRPTGPDVCGRLLFLVPFMGKLKGLVYKGYTNSDVFKGFTIGLFTIIPQNVHIRFSREIGQL